MTTEWTNEQKQAITLRDTNILVSAGAGSGKTAVLVERVVSLITDAEKPVDIDRILVVTFIFETSLPAIGPGLSARRRCIDEPSLLSGMKIRTKTRIPIPPIQ